MAGRDVAELGRVCGVPVSIAVRVPVCGRLARSGTVVIVRCSIAVLVHIGIVADFRPGWMDMASGVVTVGGVRDMGGGDVAILG